VHLTVADAEGNEVLGSIRVIVLDEANGTSDIMLVAGVGIAVALVAGAMIAYVLLRRRKGSAGN
jgi:high-affinity Fe2+/Pb2+ permease